MKKFLGFTGVFFAWLVGLWGCAGCYALGRHYLPQAIGVVLPTIWQFMASITIVLLAGGWTFLCGNMAFKVDDWKKN